MPAVRVEGLNLDFCNPTVRTGRTSYYSDTVYFGSACIAADDRCNTRVEVNQHASENDYETNCNVVVPDECPARTSRQRRASENQAESKASTRKADAASATGTSENATVNDLTLQTVLPCALTLAEQNAIGKESSPRFRSAVNIQDFRGQCRNGPGATTRNWRLLREQIDHFRRSARRGRRTISMLRPSLPRAAQLFVAKARAKVAAASIAANAASPGDFWIREEYVGWWAQGGRVPALVNTSATGSLPATVTLYGDATYNDKYRSGEWTQGGMWFDCCHEHGIQGDFFFVGRESSPFFATSDGDPILTRPFIDANTGLPAAQLIAVPGVVVGSISVDNHNWLQGAGVSLRRKSVLLRRLL